MIFLLVVMPYQTSAGIVTFQQRNGTYQVILLDHGRFISLPKGMIEEGEDRKDTAIRELREETGLDIQACSDEIVHTITYKFTNSRGELIDKTVYFYAGVAKPDQQVKISHEHDDFHIVDLDQATSLLTYDGDKQALEKAKAWLNQYKQQ